MNVRGRVAVVTGAASGIGAALTERLARDGAMVLAADLDVAGLQANERAWQAEHPGRIHTATADIAEEQAIADLLATAEARFGPVDIYCANAGILGAPGLEASDAAWARTFDVNVMAHVRAARLLVPAWVQRGEGYFVSTASAAGLLTQLGVATYSVTKHGAVGFAEWLAITYGARGVRVSCLCPMGVETPMLRGMDADANADGALAQAAVEHAGEVLSAGEVAATVMAAIAEERFLVLPHPEVAEMFASKAADYERWLAGMRRYSGTLTQPGF